MPQPALTRFQNLQERIAAVRKGEKVERQLALMRAIYAEAYAKGWIMEVLTSVIRSRPWFRPYLYAELVERLLDQKLFAQASAFVATYRTTSPADEETPPDMVLIPTGNRTPEMDLDHLVNIWTTAARFSHLEFVGRIHEAVIETVSKASAAFITIFVERTETNRTPWENETLQEALSQKSVSVPTDVSDESGTTEPLYRVR